MAPVGASVLTPVGGGALRRSVRAPFVGRCDARSGSVQCANARRRNVLEPVGAATSKSSDVKVL